MMTLLKWGVGIVLLGALALAVLGKKTFHVETVIPAPPEAVWAVLMATEKYPEWNPTFVEVSGQYEVGGTLLNKVRSPDGKVLELTATVAEVVANKTLRQHGGIWGIITFDHQWLLEPVAGGTKVTQHEVDRGLYLWFWDSSWIEPAYTRTNESLKTRVLAKSQ